MLTFILVLLFCWLYCVMISGSNWDVCQVHENEHCVSIATKLLDSVASVHPHLWPFRHLLGVLKSFQVEPGTGGYTWRLCLLWPGPSDHSAGRAWCCCSWWDDPLQVSNEGKLPEGIFLISMLLYCLQLSSSTNFLLVTLRDLSSQVFDDLYKVYIHKVLAFQHCLRSLHPFSSLP